MTVTVVTVTHNAEQYLERTLLSIIEQTYPYIELIVVDGASADGTLDIIKKYERHLARWVSEPDRGIYHAMNKAVDLATGSWINFMNAGDSFVDETVVEKFAKKVGRDAEVAYGDHIFHDGDFSELRRANISDIYKDIVFNHQSMFYRVDVLRNYLFDESFSIVADCELHLRAYGDGRKFQYLHFPVANFRGGGVNSQFRMQTIIEFLHALVKNTPHGIDIRDSYIFKMLIQENAAGIGREPAIDNGKYDGLKSHIARLCSVSLFRAPFKKLKFYHELLDYYNLTK